MIENNGIPITSSRFEVIKGMESFVDEHIDSLLKPVEESWQPSDFFPDMRLDNWKEELARLLEEGYLPDYAAKKEKLIPLSWKKPKKRMPEKVCGYFAC